MWEREKITYLYYLAVSYQNYIFHGNVNTVVFGCFKIV